jgi:hypothetical protein
MTQLSLFNAPAPIIADSKRSHLPPKRSELPNPCHIPIGASVQLAPPLAAHIYQDREPPIGVVTFIEPSGNLHVRFDDTRSCYPPSQLEPADSPNLQPPTTPNQPHPSLTAGGIAWLEGQVAFHEAGAARFQALADQSPLDHPKRKMRLHEAERCQQLANQARQKLIGGEYAATT